MRIPFKLANTHVKFDNNHFQNDYSETADATPETPDYEGQFKGGPQLSFTHGE